MVSVGRQWSSGEQVSHKPLSQSFDWSEEEKGGMASNK